MSVETGSRPRRSLDGVRAFRPSGALVAGALAAVLAGGAGWWLGGVSREQTPAPVTPTVAAVGTLQLELEHAWVRADAAPGLPVQGAEVFSPARGLAARALLVTGPAADATLIPTALRSELPGDLPAPQRATLGGLAAWTYGPLRDGGRTLEVTVAPTTAGTLALACSAPSASWTSCGHGVQAVDTGAAKALAPASDLAFRQAAGPVLERLDRQRVAGRERLSDARRAAPATALARAHREAAAALEPFAAGGATADAVTALRRAAAGYAALAAAGRDRDRARFISARRAVRSADAQLAAALAALRR
jgi:hypothetical protein